MNKERAKVFFPAFAIVHVVTTAISTLVWIQPSSVMEFVVNVLVIAPLSCPITFLLMGVFPVQGVSMFLAIVFGCDYLITGRRPCLIVSLLSTAVFGLGFGHMMIWAAGA